MKELGSVMSGFNRIIIVCSFYFGMLCAGNTPWTSFYSKTYTRHTKVLNGHKKELFFKKESTNPFTQLVFSWNITRPEQGYFSFYAQVRDAETNQWGCWHHMADWGKNKQKTYLSKSNGLSSYVHVRLEVDAHKTADAFCIKIEPHEGASLHLLDAVAVALSDFKLFVPEEPVCDNFKTIILSDVPAIAQFSFDHVDKSRICSPASCAMVVEYLTKESVCMNNFLTGIFDEGLLVYGSWSCNVAHAFDVCKDKVNFFVRRGHSFVDVYHYLEKKLPVIVSVRGDLPGALKSFPHGHLMVIVGWDQEKGEVICHDPAAESNTMVLKQYPLEPFLRAWERSHRLMYVVDQRY